MSKQGSITSTGLDLDNIRFVEVTNEYEDYQEVIAIPKDTPLDADVIKGVLLYSSSAYENAVFSDRLERGRPRTYVKDGDKFIRKMLKGCDEELYTITEKGFGPVTAADWTKSLEAAIDRREWLAGLFEKTDRPLVQFIDISKELGNANVLLTFGIPQPRSEDEIGVPMLGQFYYYVKPDITDENLANAFGDETAWNKEEEGRFTADTKIIMGRDVLGTLGEYGDDIRHRLRLSQSETAAVDKTLSFLKNTQIEQAVLAILQPCIKPDVVGFNEFCIEYFPTCYAMIFVKLGNSKILIPYLNFTSIRHPENVIILIWKHFHDHAQTPDVQKHVIEIAEHNIFGSGCVNASITCS